MCRVCVGLRYMLHLLLILISCACSDNGLGGVRAVSESESVEENKPKNIRRSYLIYKNDYRLWVWISRLDVSCIRFAPWETRTYRNCPHTPGITVIRWNCFSVSASLDQWQGALVNPIDEHFEFSPLIVHRLNSIARNRDQDKTPTLYVVIASPFLFPKGHLE